jgi:hypothetical protein
LDRSKEHGVSGSLIRVVDHDVKPGVKVDMGPGDAWPAIREQIMGANILLISTRTWINTAAFVCASSNASTPSCQRRRRRTVADLRQSRDCCHRRNEDGAHAISAALFQTLDDVGFTIPAGGVTYWNGEAMHKADYKDLDAVPEAVASTTATLATNTDHLARLLKTSPYPPT